jgi:hypothetical protein
MVVDDDLATREHRGPCENHAIVERRPQSSTVMYDYSNSLAFLG